LSTVTSRWQSVEWRRDRTPSGTTMSDGRRGDRRRSNSPCRGADADAGIAGSRVCRPSSPGSELLAPRRYRDPRGPQSLGDGEVRRHAARCQRYDRGAHRVARGGSSPPRSCFEFGTLIISQFNANRLASRNSLVPPAVEGMIARRFVCRSALALGSACAREPAPQANARRRRGPDTRHRPSV
jgi:hypothetical protein